MSNEIKEYDLKEYQIGEFFSVGKDTYKVVDAGIVEFYYLYEYRCNKGLQYLVNNGIIVRKIILEN